MRHPGLFFIALLAIAAEGAAIGYVIGKTDLDVKAKNALANKATDAIAYIKAVPPARDVPVRRTLVS
jgi:hypothetical protein